MLVIVNKAEFYATVDLSADDLKELLAEWQHYYNWERPHSAHNGKTPMVRTSNLLRKHLILKPFKQTISPVPNTSKSKITGLNL